MDYQKANLELLQYIKKSTSPFHVVLESERRLKEAGFVELELAKNWAVKQSGKYYVKAHGTSIIAFTVGKTLSETLKYRIAAAHTDHPCFKVKPHTEMSNHGYLKLNTDVYGGPIVNTWMDRPLSIAGKVALRSENVFQPEIRYIDLEKAVLTIPNLAIHMNREVNKGVELNRQIDTLPLIGLLNEKLNEKEFFINYLADTLEVNVKDILDFDLYIYNAEEGTVLGMNDDFVSSPRLDNLTSCFALLEGIMKETREKDVNLIALLDNEEIGSKTKQGADSNLLTFVLEKISASLSYSHTDYYNSILDSICISVDVAHAVHPNHTEKGDPTNVVKLNEGFALKLNSNQRYATDSEAVAIIQQLCEANEIMYQKYVNRSDMIGGSTLGSITSAWLPMKTVDLGIPMLAMHSAREVMGSKDQANLNALLRKFFSINE